MVPVAFEIGWLLNGFILTEYSPEEEFPVSSTFSSEEKLIEYLRHRLYIFNEDARKMFSVEAPEKELLDEEIPMCLQGISVTEDMDNSEKELAQALTKETKSTSAPGKDKVKKIQRIAKKRKSG